MPIGANNTALAVAPPFAPGTQAPAAAAPATAGYLNSSRKKAIGNASFRLDPEQVTAMPDIPPGAQSAIFIVEATTGYIPGQPLARFWMDGTWPTDLSGLPAYDGSVIEVQGMDDLKNFAILSVDGLSHSINIQYFSAI